MNNIGEKLKTLRQSAGLTQQSVAESLHMTRQAISNYENNKTQPDYETLAGLAKLYGTDVAEILGEPQFNSEEPTLQKRFGAGKLLFILIPLILAAAVIFFVLSRPHEIPEEPLGTEQVEEGPPDV